MIGGIFGLETPSATPSFPYAESPCCAYVSSGRAALECLLHNMPRPRCVWVPRMACDTLLEPLQRMGLPAARYGCDAQFRPLLPQGIGAGDLLILINYFGLTGDAVAQTVAAAPCRCVVDATTALYAPPLPGVPAFYSLRKFAGVPDGGVALAPFPLPQLPPEEADSTPRMLPLQQRAAQGAAAACAASEAAEQSLSAPPQRMSALTRQLLGTLDFAAAARRRLHNYAVLHRALAPLNRLTLPAVPPCAPMCYPFVSGIPDLRDNLIDAGIALPLYWPEVIETTRAHEPENRLARTLLPLPLDQRYTAADMQRILSAIL